MTVQEHPNDDPFRQPRANMSPAAQKLDEHLATSIAELSPSAPQPAATGAKSMSVTGIGGTGGTIKQLLVEHKAQMSDLIEGHVAQLKDTLVKQRDAVGALGRMVQSATDETNAFLADLGQFTNDLGV